MKGRARRTTVACCALVAGLANAPAATAAERYDYDAADFVLRLSAAAVQARADVPQAIPTDLGYSSVGLTKDVFAPYAQCQVVGAGVHLTENNVFENYDLPDAGNNRDNPRSAIEARDTAPNLSPGDFYPRRPQPVPYARQQLRDVGLGEDRLPWAARCESDSAGTGAGNTLAASTGAAGSTTTGRLDKRTGTYVGTSRAFAAGLTTPSGTVAALSSTVKVTHKPGKQPVADYRIAANGNTLITGTSVPLQDLTRQFNERVRDNAAALAAIGELGLTLAGPTVDMSEDHAREVVHFPFVEAAAGFQAREGGIGQGQRVRLLTVSYEGLHRAGPSGFSAPTGTETPS